MITFILKFYAESFWAKSFFCLSLPVFDSSLLLLTFHFLSLYLFVVLSLSFGLGSISLSSSIAGCLPTLHISLPKCLSSFGHSLSFTFLYLYVPTCTFSLFQPNLFSICLFPLGFPTTFSSSPEFSSDWRVIHSCWWEVLQLQRRLFIGLHFRLFVAGNVDAKKKPARLKTCFLRFISAATSPKDFQPRQ